MISLTWNLPGCCSRGRLVRRSSWCLFCSTSLASAICDRFTRSCRARLLLSFILVMESCSAWLRRFTFSRDLSASRTSCLGDRWSCFDDSSLGDWGCLEEWDFRGDWGFGGGEGCPGEWGSLEDWGILGEWGCLADWSFLGDNLGDWGTIDGEGFVDDEGLRGDRWACWGCWDKDCREDCARCGDVGCLGDVCSLGDLGCCGDLGRRGDAGCSDKGTTPTSNWSEQSLVRSSIKASWHRGCSGRFCWRWLLRCPS